MEQKTGEEDASNYHDYIDGYSFATDRYSENEPVLRQHSYSRKEIITSKVCEFIVDKLNANEYVILFVDEYYLPGTYLYMRRHFLHEQLLFGYDDQLQIFYGMGLNHRKKYAELSYSYMAIQHAYEEGLECSEHGDIEWAERNRLICLSKINSSSGMFPICLEEYINKISTYLTGKISPRQEYYIQERNMSHYYGINYYELAKQTLSKENLYEVFKHVNHLLEHKKMLMDGARLICKCCGVSFLLYDELLRMFEDKIINELQLLRTKLLYYVQSGRIIKNTAEIMDKLEMVKKQSMKYWKT